MDGGVTVTESRPNPVNNTTETNTTIFSAPNASGEVTVTGQGSGLTSGIGAANTGIPAFDKSGLATEATLTGIKSDTGAIKDALTGQGVDSSLGAEKSAFGSALDALTGLFADEPGKDAGGLSEGFNFGGYMPAQCGCTPLTMTIMGHTASYDWCAPISTIKSALAWVVGILAAWYCLGLFRVGGAK